MVGELILFFTSLLICCVISYLLVMLRSGDTRNEQLKSFFILKTKKP